MPGCLQLRSWQTDSPLNALQAPQFLHFCASIQILYNHKKLSEPASMKQQLQEDYSLESYQSVEFQYLNSVIYQELLQAHHRAQLFIQELGVFRDTLILQSLVSYCKDVKISFEVSDLVVDLMEARLNKIVKNNKLKKNWSTEDLQILVWLISKYLEKNGIPSHESLVNQDWEKISSMLPGTTAKGCMFKFISLKKFKLAHNKWQKDEESLLFQIIEEVGTENWKEISEKLYERNPKKSIHRTAKQCREHWSCYLDPAIKKGPWEKEEDRKLLQTVFQNNFQKKWSVIKHEFEGRTENALKNRYNLLLQKQKRISVGLSQQQLLVEMLKEQSTGDSSELKDTTQNRNNILIPVPVIPEERRYVELAFQPGILIFFNPGEYQYSAL